MYSKHFAEKLHKMNGNVYNLGGNRKAEEEPTENFIAKNEIS